MSFVRAWQGLKLVRLLPFVLLKGLENHNWPVKSNKMHRQPKKTQENLDIKMVRWKELL